MKRSPILDRPISAQLFNKALVLGLGIAGLALTSHAQKVWSGPSGENLATGTNWVGGAAPVDGDILRWNGTVAGPLSLTSSLTTANGVFLEITAGQTDSLSINPTSALRLRDITIEAGAGAFSLGDGVGALNSAPFTLGSGSVTTTTFTNNSSNTATINSDVQFANGGGVANRTLVLTGTKNWTVNTTLAPTGSGTTNLTKSGTGTLNVGNANALGVAGRTFTITGGALDNITGAALTTSNVLQVWNGDFAFGGTNALNLGTGTVSLGTTAGTSRTITTNGSALLTVGGVISNGTTVNSLIKAGPGSLRLDGANTYTGGTTLLSGQLHVGNNSALGTGTLTINSGTIVPRGASRTLANAVAVGGDFVLGDFMGLNNVLTLSGAVDLGGATRTVTVLDYVAAGDGLDTTWSGAISNGALTKAGAGTLVLTGNSSFNGATTVTEGTVLLSGIGAVNGSSGIIIDGSSAKFVQASSVASTPTITLTQGTLDGTGTVGAVNVGALGMAILANGNGGTGTLTTGNLTFGGAAEVNITTNGTNAGIAAGTLTTSGVNGAIVLNINRTGTWNNGANNLISYTSFVSADINDFALGNIVGPNLGARQAFGGLVLNGNNIALQINGTSVYWTGLQSNQWTTNTVGGGQNWKKTSDNLGTDFITGDDVVFNDAPGTNQTIQINDGDVSTTTTTFNNSTAVSYTITSSGSFGISSGSLTKNGTGTVTLASTNTYGDGTTLNAGKLNVNNEMALGFGAVKINGGTLDNTSGSPITLATSNTQNWNGDFAFAGTNSLDMGMGAVTLGGTGNRTITVSANTLTVGGITSTTQGFTKTGAGTLQLNPTAASSIGGTLTVSAGTFDIGHDFTATGLAGSGTIINDGFAPRSLIINTTGADSFGGTLADGTLGSTLGLTKQGTGTLTLSGSNSYSGVTTVGGGALIVTNDSALGSTFGNTSVQAGGSLQLQGGVNLAEPLVTTGSGDGNTSVSIATLSPTAPGAIRSLSGVNTISSIISLTSGAGHSVVRVDSGSTLNLTGDIAILSGQTSRNLILGGAGTGTISGIIANNFGGTGVLGVDKVDAGTWTLSGNNTYTGNTTVAAGTLNLTGAISGGTITVASGATLNESSTTAIGGTGGLTVAGTAILSGQNSFSGKTIINGGGVVTVSSLNNVGTPVLASSLGTPTTVANGTIDMTGANGNGTLIYTGSGEITDRVVNLAAGANPGLSAILDQSGTGLLKFTSNFTATGTQTHTLVLQGSTTGAGEIAGAIVNNSATNITSLTKRGTGTWTLSGANTYTGPTVVEAGTLITNTTQTGVSTVTVADGATFGVKQATAGTTFNVGALTAGTATGSTLILDAGALGNPTAPLLSATTFTPAAPTLLKVMGSALTIGSNIPLLDYTGTIGGVGFAGLSLALPARTVGNLVDNTIDTRVDLNITQFEQIKWNGNANGNWDADIDGTGATGSLNWLTTVTNTPTKYLQGTGGTDTVNFDDSATGTTNINVATAVAPVATNFNNSAKDYSLSSTGGFGIGSTGALTKSGTGKLALNTANTYSGGTTLNGGTLVLGNANAIGTGTLTINGGRLDATAPTVLSTNNAQNWNGDFSFGGTSDLDMGSGAVTIAGAGTNRIVTINGGRLSVGEIKAVAHGLNKQGAGTLVVASAGDGANGSVIAGTLNVETGTLQINRTDATAAISGDFTAGGLTGTGAVVNGAAIERWLFVNTTGTHDFTGTLANGGTGGLGFNKQGTGTQTLSGTNSYTGATTVGGGTLILKVANTGAGTNATVNAGNLVLGSTSALGTNSLIRLAGNNVSTLTFATDGGDNLYAFTQGTTTHSTIISDRATPGEGINHTLTTQDGANGVGGGSITFNSGANVTSGMGRITIPYLGLGAGSVQTTVLNPTTANVTIGDISKANNNFSQTIELGGSSQGNLVTGAISNGFVLTGTNAVSLTKSGTSTWTLSGANSYTGATTVNGGELIVSGGLSGTSSVSVAGGATLSGSSSIATGGVNGSVTLAAGSFLEPGNGTTGNVGTLDFSLSTGVLDIAAATTNTGSLKFDLAAPGASDLVTLSFVGMNIGTNVLGFSDFAFNALEGFGQGTYTLFDGSSPITGTLNSADLTGSIGSAFVGTLSIGDNGNDIVLTVVPEPGSATLLLTGFGSLLGLRRIRRRAV